MSGLSLVTGGCGFIGRHLVRALAARGERVRVLDLAPGDGLPEQVEIVRGSILDRDSVDRAMAGATRVYHLAGNPNLWAPRAASFLEVNLEGTRTVLAAARRHRIERVIYTSTESILKKSRGWLRRPADAAPVDENAKLTVDDMPGPYCRSKFLAEAAASAAAGDGLPVVIVNPTMPIGPGDVHLSPPTKMVLRFLNGEIPAYLDCTFNLVDVRDVAIGHILAAERGQVGERYILGHENLTLGGLLARLAEITGLAMPRRKVPYALALAVAFASEGVAKLTGRPPVAPLTGVRLAGTPLSFDPRKAVTVLGLPQTPVRTALADAVADLVARGLVRRAIRAA